MDPPRRTAPKYVKPSLSGKTWRSRLVSAGPILSELADLQLVRRLRDTPAVVVARHQDRSPPLQATSFLPVRGRQTLTQVRSGRGSEVPKRSTDCTSVPISYCADTRDTRPSRPSTDPTKRLYTRSFTVFLTRGHRLRDGMSPPMDRPRHTLVHTPGRLVSDTSVRSRGPKGEE